MSGVLGVLASCSSYHYNVTLGDNGSGNSNVGYYNSEFGSISPVATLKGVTIRLILTLTVDPPYFTVELDGTVSQGFFAGVYAGDADGGERRYLSSEATTYFTSGGRSVWQWQDAAALWDLAESGQQVRVQFF